jgi:hypothetical protein
VRIAMPTLRRLQWLDTGIGRVGLNSAFCIEPYVLSFGGLHAVQAGFHFLLDAVRPCKLVEHPKVGCLKLLKCLKASRKGSVPTRRNSAGGLDPNGIPPSPMPVGSSLEELTVSTQFLRKGYNVFAIVETLDGHPLESVRMSPNSSGCHSQVPPCRVCASKLSQFWDSLHDHQIGRAEQQFFWEVPYNHCVLHVGA